VPDALFYPYSRWLNDVGLKRAVLIYDHLLFVDPVDQATRADLYLREGRHHAESQDLPGKWLDAADSYRALDDAGIVRTIARPAVDPGELDALVDHGLQLDLRLNEAGSLFSGRRRWQMLEERLPPSAFTYFRARDARRDWFGQSIVHVPHAVAASVTLTTAMVAAHQEGVAPITDEPAHDTLLRLRLRQAALEPQALPDVLRFDRPYTRNRVEKRLLGITAPAAALRRMTMQEVIVYRDSHAEARREVGRLIDRLTHEVRVRPWDLALDDELERIAEEIRSLIVDMPGPVSARRAMANELGKPSLKAKVAVAVSVAGTGVAAHVTPNLPLLAGLAAGGLAIGKGLSDAVLGALDRLCAERSPEQNALCYLQRAR
jgi:hypothetical protein